MLLLYDTLFEETDSIIDNHNLEKAVQFVAENKDVKAQKQHDYVLHLKEKMN